MGVKNLIFAVPFFCFFFFWSISVQKRGKSFFPLDRSTTFLWYKMLPSFLRHFFLLFLLFALSLSDHWVRVWSGSVERRSALARGVLGPDDVLDVLGHELDRDCNDDKQRDSRKLKILYGWLKANLFDGREEEERKNTKVQKKKPRKKKSVFFCYIFYTFVVRSSRDNHVSEFFRLRKKKINV